MRDIFRVNLSLVFALLSLVLSSARAELPPLIPREVLFGNPERVSPQISPDGTRLAWIAPNTNNVLQVWVKTIGKDDDKVVTADKKRGIRQYFWAEDSRTVIYMQDMDGDENWHAYGVDLVSGNIRDYTAFQGVRVQVTATDNSGNGSQCAFNVTVLGALGVQSNVLSELRTLRSGATVKTDRTGLDLVLKRLTNALATINWKDQTHADTKKGAAIFTAQKAVVSQLNTLLKNKVMFGSDYPLITPDRWLSDFEKIGIRDEVRPLILKENAVRLLFGGARPKD